MRDNQTRDDRGERKKYKIINISAIVTVYICIAIVHKCIILHPLMWVLFGPKCVKILHFSILQKSTQSDVIAKWITLEFRQLHTNYILLQ